MKDAMKAVRIGNQFPVLTGFTKPCVIVEFDAGYNRGHPG